MSRVEKNKKKKKLLAFKIFITIMLTSPTINPRTNSKMEKTVSFI